MRLIYAPVLFISLLASFSSWGANYVCGQDIDGDGEINKNTEYAQCIGKPVEEQSLPSTSCRAGYTIKGDKCEKTTVVSTTPTCAVGTFDAASQQCKNTVTDSKIVSCPSGYTLKGSQCEKTTVVNTTPTCSVGTFDAASQQCKNTVTAIKVAQCPSNAIKKADGTCVVYSYANLTASCSAGWYYQDGVCKQDRSEPADIGCPADYTYSTRWGVCRKPNGFTPTGMGCPGYQPSDSATRDGYRCQMQGQSGQFWATNYYVASSFLTCSTGTLSGSVCILPPYTTGATFSCPAGYSRSGDSCVKEQVVSPNYICPAGMTDNGSNCTRIDYSPASWVCPPTYTKNGNQCYKTEVITPTYTCPAGMTDNGANCIRTDYSQASWVCPASYIKNGNQCSLTEYDNIIYSCPSGTNVDYGTPACAAGFKYSSRYNICRKTNGTSPATSGSCDFIPTEKATEGAYSKTWQGSSCVLWSTKYETSPIKTGPSCTSSKPDLYCPINANPACLSDNGGAECSPNKCIDLDVNTPVDEGNIDGSMLVNDGEKNSDGLCLDQMFIFNGRAQDCKKPGVSNAFKDCCKSEGKALADDAGSLMSAAQGMSTVSHIYSAATEAYTAYNAAIQAGQTATAAMNSGVAAAQNYMLVAFDPTTLAISVAMYVVMKYLATACDQMSMETALMNDSGYCHEVGTYCKKKIKFIGCVQKATSFCCFNSKLARLIHEQGRPQLKTGINNWGTPEAPLCRGFTPEEFQSVDFGKIDLTEYINDVQKNATEEIQKNMNTITNDFLQQAN